MKKYLAEFFGTFWLVFAGCGSLIFAADFSPGGIGLLGVSFAFGLSLLTMEYTIGNISGCHINPAVSFGLFLAGRFPARELLPYMVFQVLGGVAAGGVLFLIASGNSDFSVAKNFAANGYGLYSPGYYSLVACFLTEMILTMMFLLVILGVNDSQVSKGFVPIAIGFCFVLIHLISIPITNTSVNPARSTGVAFYVGGWAISQLWLFWVAPFVGSGLGAVVYRCISGDR